MHAASTMKVPVMIEVFRQAERGKFSLQDSVEVINEFKSIIDGRKYILTILTRGFSDPNQAKNCIAEISYIIYNIQKTN